MKSRSNSQLLSGPRNAQMVYNAIPCIHNL